MLPPRRTAAGATEATMYGRAIIAQGDPARLGEFEAFVRDRVDPAVRAIKGNAGMSLYINRDTAEVIVVSGWLDEQALDASRSALTALRDEGIALVGAAEARIVTVEPVLMEQKAPDQVGYWTRSVEVMTPLEAMESSEEAFRRDVLPRIREFDGVNTVALLADRATGRHVLNVTYVSRDALDAAAEQGRALRDAFLADAGRALTSVMETEIRIVGMGPPMDEVGAEQAEADVPAQSGVSDRSSATAR
jgi:quinol monooxygenase YgiN